MTSCRSRSEHHRSEHQWSGVDGGRRQLPPVTKSPVGTGLVNSKTGNSGRSFVGVDGPGGYRMVMLRDCGICATPSTGEPSAGIICGRFSVVSGAAVEGWTGGDPASDRWWPFWRARVGADHSGILGPLRREGGTAMVIPALRATAMIVISDTVDDRRRGVPLSLDGATECPPVDRLGFLPASGGSPGPERMHFQRTPWPRGAMR